MIAVKKRIPAPPPYSGSINTTERRLVLYSPSEQFSPPQRKRKSARRRIQQFTACLCAALSILTVTLTALNAALLSERIRPETLILRLGNQALLGIASVSVASPPDDTLSLPPETPDTDTNTEKEGSSPADTTGEPTPPPPVLPEYAILKADISSGGDIHTLNNETAYLPDTQALLDAPLAFSDLDTHMEEFGTAYPYILILHTHGTESFAREGADTYTTADTFRTDDPAESIVAVGAVMAETFREAGIPVLHCTEMFDRDSYQDSYSRAAAAIRAYLEEYPSIQVVLDVHRDSIIRTDMTKIRPVTTADSVQTAQFMIVTGTDFKGADHPDWTKNLNFALKIQKNLSEKNPHFARAINLRGAGFNQQYTTGSLLLEVGSCGNTLTEAKRAGVLAAIAIAETVSGRECTLRLSHILP